MTTDTLTLLLQRDAASVLCLGVSAELWLLLTVTLDRRHSQARSENAMWFSPARSDLLWLLPPRTVLLKHHFPTYSMYHLVPMLTAQCAGSSGQETLWTPICFTILAKVLKLTSLPRWGPGPTELTCSIRKWLPLWGRLWHCSNWDIRSHKWQKEDPYKFVCFQGWPDYILIKFSLSLNFKVWFLVWGNS